MQDRTKLGAAVVGGYILGRTKKGMAAARFAMWLSGSPQVMGAARTALSAPEVKAVTDQVSGPLADAARKAALAAVLNRVGSLSDNLTKRTEALTSTIESTATDVTDTATDTAKSAGGGVKDALGKVGEAVKPKRKRSPKPKAEPEAEEKPEQEEGGEKSGDGNDDADDLQARKDEDGEPEGEESEDEPEEGEQHEGEQQ